MAWLLICMYLINILLALYLVLFRDKDTSVTWAWLMVFLFLPVLGFFLYIFFGAGLNDKQKFVVERHHVLAAQELRNQIDPKNDMFTYPSDQTGEDTEFLFSLNQLPISHNNYVKIITDGHDLLEDLKEDCRKAQKSIHIEFYAFVTDRTGLSLLKILTEKAKQGVEVKILYDELGSKGVDTKHFVPLLNAGGKVSTYLTSQQAILKFRLNYHNHRKIVVIDNQISYTGGFNIANQYVEPVKPFGYWRDTHIRIAGPASILLQLTFIMDWNVSVRNRDKISYKHEYFYQSLPENDKGIDIQIVSSGPNNEKQEIKLTFVKLISLAKKRIWIQTPYLIPDDTIIDVLAIAKRSGVDVKIMVPDKPDHPFIFRATQFYSNVLLKKHIDIFSYNGGFLHSKIMIIDDDVSIVGSANQDIRSYKLNFEASAVIFDETVNTELTNAFEKDLIKSTHVTHETYRKMSRWTILKQKVSRLFSPIM